MLTSECSGRHGGDATLFAREDYVEEACASSIRC